MIDVPWWERWPARYEVELRELDRARIQWDRDDDAFQQGVLKLRLTVLLDGERIPLNVVFPDLYPYFRFEVYAPTLRLPYHQNPFEHNLCLIGRRTHWWNTDDTVAGLIREKLPTVIRTACSTDRTVVAGLEERQAEPFSTYYHYSASMVVMPSDWSVGAGHKSGTLVIGTVPNPAWLPDCFFRGVAIEIRNDEGEILYSVAEGFRRVCSGRILKARWVRLNEPIRHADAGAFMERLLNGHPSLRNAPSNRLGQECLRICGVLFPEEIGWRTEGEGWIFVTALDASQPTPSGRRQGERKRKRKERKKRR